MQNRNHRAGYTGGIRKKSFGISFLIHSAGIFLLVVSPWKKPSLVTQDIFTVQIIELPKMETAKIEMPEGEKLMIPKPAAEKQITVREKPPMEEQKAVKKEAPRERPSFSAGKFRENLIAKTTNTSKSATGTTSEKTTANLPVKVEQVGSHTPEITNITAITPSMTIPQWYLSMVQSRIKANWRTSSMLGARTSTVSFRISRNGQIGNVNLEKSSGNANFDRSVVEAVQTTRQLPYFPEEIPDAYLDIVIDFKTEG